MRPLPDRRHALGLIALLGLAACSPEPQPAAGPGDIALADAVDALAEMGRGFSAGTPMSRQVVYVLFDPQCPHCGHLWNASRPLMSRTRFVWLPVAILNASSRPQGGALLTAGDPVAAMNEHEKLLLEGRGGMTASARIPDDVEAAIALNTELLQRLGADAVPFIVARHAGTGQTVSHAGSLSTEALAALLGLP
ncbi:MAG: DsbC family protein [Burkholderiales bacterium]|nr:MAG: DsbC family protein [Burkholderiales bacterium]